MSSSALSPEEEAEHLLYLRGLEAGWASPGAALLLKELDAKGPEKSPSFLGFTHILRHLGIASAWAKAIPLKLLLCLPHL